jgi:hypothetical protein
MILPKNIENYCLFCMLMEYESTLIQYFIELVFMKNTHKTFIELTPVVRNELLRLSANSVSELIQPYSMWNNIIKRASNFKIGRCFCSLTQPCKHFSRITENYTVTTVILHI